MVFAYLLRIHLYEVVMKCVDLHYLESEPQATHLCPTDLLNSKEQDTVTWPVTFTSLANQLWALLKILAHFKLSLLTSCFHPLPCCFCSLSAANHVRFVNFCFVLLSPNINLLRCWRTVTEFLSRQKSLGSWDCLGSQVILDCRFQ